MEGYGYQRTSFEQIYPCYSASFIEKPQIESGDKIIMPPSALNRLESLRVDYPMLFELKNGATERVSHCGVLEFTADEGNIYMPYWMMQNLLLQEGDTVRVKNASLPKGTYVKFQPHTKDLLDISNPKAILESTLRNFSCLSSGDTIMVAYNKKKYYLDVKETKPANAISIIETDCEVDFVTPLDCQKLPLAAKKALDKAKCNPFSGNGRRLDGKSSRPKDKGSVFPNVSSVSCTSSTSPSNAPAPAPACPSQGKLVFGSNVFGTKETGKEKTESTQKPSHQKQPKFQPFVGKKYSLRG